MSNGRSTGVRITASRVIPAVMWVLLAVTAGAARGQGAYDPVTDADVVAMRMIPRFGPDGTAREAVFEWSFTDDGKFVVKKGTGPIPAHLLKALLKPESRKKAAAVDELRGKWAVKDGQLVLTDIRAGDVEGVEKAQFHIYRSAPTVIRIDDRQKGPDGKQRKVQYAFAIEC